MGLLTSGLGLTAAHAANIEIDVHYSTVNISVEGKELTSAKLIILDKGDLFIFNSIFDGLKAIEFKLSNEKNRTSENILPITFAETDTVSSWDWTALDPIAGDFIGSEGDDLLLFYGLAGDFSMIWAFEGNENRLLQPESAWASGYEKWNGGDTQLVSGDFNKDGLLDVVGFYGYGEHFSRAWLFENNGAGFNDPDIWWSSSGTWSGKSTQILAGDYDNDKKEDLIGFYGYDNRRSTVWFFRNNGKGFDNPVAWWNSTGEWNGADTQMLSGDFDLDGFKDLIGFYNYNNRHTRAWFLKGFGGGFYVPSIWWDSAGRYWDAAATRFSVGDFNGDSLLDVFALFSYKNKRASAWVFTNRGNSFTDPVKLWDSGPGNWDGERTKIVSGDFDGDGIASSVAAVYGMENGGTTIYIIGPIDDLANEDLWDQQF